MDGFLDGATPLAFAHRGFAPDGDENSMAAFARAVALGYRYLETDVRVTADGVALAFHDATLDRVTDRRGAVHAMPWAQVSAARIAGREPIPRLEDVLAAWPDVRINIDIKSEAGIAATVDAIRRTASVDRVCVASFSGHRLAAARRALGPRLCSALGPADSMTLRWANRGPGRARLAGRCAQVPARIGLVPLVDRGYLRAAHRLDVQVHVWTVNDTTEMTRLLNLGVDGIISDRADLLRGVLVARGQWPGPSR